MTGRFRTDLAVESRENLGAGELEGVRAEARDLRKDDNFNQSTVAKKGRLEAPRLSLEGGILWNRVDTADEKVQVYSFNLKLADIDTGKVIWTYNKPFGTKKVKGTFGW